MITNSVREPGTTTEIPPELLRSIPRNVVLSRAGKAAAGLAITLVAAAVAMGVALYITSVRDTARHREIIGRSAITNGNVVRLGSMRDHGKRVVYYSFRVQGQAYSGNATLERRQWSGLQAGSPTSVRYLPADPQQNWIVGHEPAGIPVWLSGVAPVSLLIAPVVIGLTLRKERALLADGRAALGRVTRLKRIHGQHLGGRGLRYGYTPGQRSGYRVYYEFNDLSGARRTGRANVGSFVAPEGSPLVVVYNPDEPQRSAPYPLHCVRIAAEF